MPYTKFEDTYDSNQPPITDFRLDFIESGVAAAIADVEDGTSFGVDLADLPEATDDDMRPWVDQQNYLLAVINGVAYKLPIEELVKKRPGLTVTGSGSVEWSYNESGFFLSPTAPITLTLPILTAAEQTASFPNVQVANIGTSTIELTAASGVTINKSASLAGLKVPAKGVAYFTPYFTVEGVTTVYAAYGDLVA